MKEEFKKDYFKWGLTAFCVLLALLLVFFAFYRWEFIVTGIGKFLSLMAPFFFGVAFAYLLNPVVNFFETKVFNKLVRKLHTKKIPKRKLTRILSLGTSTIIFLGVLLSCFSFLIPEMIKSLQMLVNNVDVYLANSKDLLIGLFGGNNEIRMLIDSNFSSFSSVLNNVLNDDFINRFIETVSIGLLGTVKFIYNVAIGYIISLYILNDKEKFKAQFKKILYTFFSSDKVNIILENTRYTDKVFINFFSGRLIDALIVGILCFLGMLLFDMPYALIVSMIVGVTNVIPYFGPFIGAIPSAILILLVDPVKCITFTIFIFILQQIDGNILAPKILGSKTGLSSFWVLFSLLIFGGLFGVIGMIVGVPIFSILYSFVNGLIKNRLKSKDLPTESKDYEKLQYIDEETNELVYDK